jgi:hypothetical protein
LSCMKSPQTNQAARFSALARRDDAASFTL